MGTILRKYGAAATLDGISLYTANSNDLKANPTLASGDVQISKDGGAFANITTLPAATPASGVAVRVSLSATEMQAARIVVKFVDQTATKEWDDLSLVIETFGNASAQYVADFSAMADASGNVAVGSIATGAITASAIAADAIGASELAADAITEIQSGLATAAAIAALNNLSASGVWDLTDGIETGETPRETLRLLRAILVGILTRTAGTTETGTAEFLRADETTVAATVEYDAGERTVVTIGDLT